MKSNTSPPWIVEAVKWVGTKEGAGKLNNPVVVAFYKDAGFGGVKDDAVPWCAAFVGACLMRVGIKATGSLWAIDYSGWGANVKRPTFGAIAYKKRKNKSGKVVGGHVGFVVGWDRAHVYILGGNQSDMVNVSKYKRSDIEGYRYPVGLMPLAGIPDGFKLPGLNLAGSEA